MSMAFLKKKGYHSHIVKNETNLAQCKVHKKRRN